MAILELLQNSEFHDPDHDHHHHPLEAPLSAGALLAILNGDFETQNSGWQTRGDSNILNGQAILSENSQYLSNLRQTFTIPKGAKALQFTLVNTHLDDSDQAPPDAFEVALLNVQHDGTPYTSDHGNDRVLETQHYVKDRR